MKVTTITQVNNIYKKKPNGENKELTYKEKSIRESKICDDIESLLKNWIHSRNRSKKQVSLNKLFGTKPRIDILKAILNKIEFSTRQICIETSHSYKTVSSYLNYFLKLNLLRLKRFNMRVKIYERCVEDDFWQGIQIIFKVWEYFSQ